MFCQSTGDDSKFRVHVEVRIQAPADYVYSNWPLSFDQDQIFGLDKN